MEIVVFFVFIAVCAFALVWASRRTRSETELERTRRRERNKSSADKLSAPRDNLLSHNDQVWRSRRQHATSGVLATNRFVPKSEASGTPEYDGYSRRDRHHVMDPNAHIKDERKEDEFTMTAVEFEADKKTEPDKAAG